MENQEAVVVIQVGSDGWLALDGNDAGSKVGSHSGYVFEGKVNKINTDKSPGTTDL